MGQNIVIVAGIPVKNNLKWTAPLVMQLIFGDDVDQIWIYDNGSTDLTKSWIENQQQLFPKIKYINSAHMKFYEMWNHMIKTACDIGSVKLAILNNDIRLPHMALKNISELMVGYQIAQVDGRIGSFNSTKNAFPQQIRWTDRLGHAFMLDADFWADKEYAVHPSLNIWFGDDDLFRRCSANGGLLCEIRGIGCDHGWHKSYEYYLSSSGSLDSDIELDRISFLKIWQNY